MKTMLDQSPHWEQWESKCIASCQVFLHGRHPQRSILIPALHHTVLLLGIKRSFCQVRICLQPYVNVSVCANPSTNHVSALNVYNYRSSGDSMFDTWDGKHLSNSIRFSTSIWEQFAFSAVRSSTQRLTKAFTELERCVRSLRRLHRNFSGPHPVPRLASSDQLLSAVWV